MAGERAIEVAVTELALVQGCPLCYWLSKRSLSPPAMPLPGILNKVDSVVKKFMSRFVHRRDLPDWFPVSGTFMGESGQLEATDSESGVVLRGKLDAFVRADDGKYVVVDYKASSPREEVLEYHRLQLDGYAFLLEKNGYSPVSEGILLHFMPAHGDLTERRFPFEITPVHVQVNPSRIPPILSRARKIIEMESPPAPDENCGMCRWRIEVERKLRG
jgi:CRISPR/Cas system-associated exonuclease Cas4 (RecB family)